MRVLLDHGAAVNQAWNDGWTPLLIASQDAHEGIVRLLLEHGATVNHTTMTAKNATMTRHVRWAGRHRETCHDDSPHPLGPAPPRTMPR